MVNYNSAPSTVKKIGEGGGNLVVVVSAGPHRWEFCSTRGSLFVPGKVFSLFWFLLGGSQPLWELVVGGKVGLNLSLLFSCLPLDNICILRVYFFVPFCKLL